jgi:cell wall-associated NlpC family hydrolase
MKKQKDLENAQAQLHNELDKLKSVQDELAAEQKKIEEDKQTVQQELADSKNNLQLQQAKLAQQQAEELAQQKALQQAAELARQQAAQKAAAQQQAQQTSSGSSTSAPTTSTDNSNLTNSDKASKVIAYAEQFLGTPYVWGGSSPSGFDCSGLMLYVFHSVGVNLPRTANEQQNAGTRISPSSVQPGDLVFKSTGGVAYHVGMYIGGGKWIQSPETGDVVKISNYDPSKFQAAARVLK